MENENENLVNVSDCEIEFFDDDPDGEPDRAGDGYYFRVPGDDSWSGPWHSEEEAERELKEQLELNEDRAIERLFADEGWLAVIGQKDTVSYLNKIEDRWFSISIGDKNVVLSERTRNQSSPIRAVNEIEQDQDDPMYGLRLQALKNTLGVLKVGLEIEVPAPRM